MLYRISQPSIILSRYVKYYWTLENHVPDGKKHIQRIVPHGLPELIFYFGDKPLSKDKNKSIGEKTLLTSQLGKFYDIEITGKLSLFSIIFQPHGLSMFLDVPLNELYNKNVPLKFIFREDTDKLENKLFEAKSFPERITIAENFLVKLLYQNRYKYNLNRIEESVNIITRTKGKSNIDNLASKACLSRKQFERIFSYCVGTSPKQFLKTVRFQSAINEKSIQKNITLTDLTFVCGYYDQSHMISDFHQLAGMSPKQYFNECEPYSDYFH